MLLVSNYVAASEIEGVGVFAAARISKGALIWRLNPDFDRLLPADSYDSLPETMKELINRYAYPSPDKPGYLVYEVDNGRFMNHSDTPNTDFSEYGGGFALKDIAPGEELTCDYSQFYEAFELQPVSSTGKESANPG
jgi:uncharacterized protein